MKKIIVLVIAIALLVLLTTIFILSKDNYSSEKQVPVVIVTNEDTQNVLSEELTEEEHEKLEVTNNNDNNNSLSNFDLSFLKLEQGEKNLIYSPLSIKYALKMLEEAASGDSKAQITKLIGDYSPTKYVSNENMSLANGLFVKDSFKENVKQAYIDLLKTKYDAEVKFDSFESAKNINSWIKEKTLNIIPEVLQDGDVNLLQFALVNALAIDMEWEELFLDESNYYEETILRFPHEDVSYVSKPFEVETMSFNGSENVYSSMKVNATVNNYDIVTELGEENIRKTVEDAFWKQLEDEYQQKLFKESYPDESQEEWIKNYLNEYMKETKENYHKYASSTEFSIHSDDDILVFSKDLKKYDNTTLQYIGIMPRKEDLKEYVNSLDANSLNNLINQLKPIKTESFKEGVATTLLGYIPKFKFNYSLDFQKDLETLGIKNVFDLNLAELSNITSIKKGDPNYYNIYISKAIHSADIEFTQNGIKAAAVTIFSGGGGGGDSFEFDYIFDVPTEEIDINFNKPFLFLIRDKDTKETWFVGTVNEPTRYDSEERSYGGGA